MREALTFDDVSLVPAYNKYPSRGDTRITTTVKIGNYSFEVPIISANMDTITGPAMAKKMAELGGLGILHRFCTIEENVQMFKDAIETYYRAGDITCPVYSIVGVSVGVNEGLNRAKALYEAGARIFCVDVAHGFSKACGDMVRMLKESFPEILIIAGNVCNYAGADFLVGAGADVVKVGIGPGCFTPWMYVETNDGPKDISSIEIGDLVYTHTGELKPVIDTFQREVDEKILVINDIECTKQHQFYVVNKTDAGSIDDFNLHKYAYWIEAQDLDKDKHLLVQALTPDEEFLEDLNRVFSKHNKAIVPSRNCEPDHHDPLIIVEYDKVTEEYILERTLCKSAGF